MPSTLFNIAVCATLLLAVFVSETTAHSHLVKPFPNSRFIGGCRVGRGFDCPGPCVRDGLQGHRSNENAVATFQRGQRIDTAWTKNNHIGGFVRWAIVRKQDMHNRDAHKRGTIEYRCWDARLINCRKGDFNCVDDQQGKAFEDTLVIPKIYPDGEYVLGWVWFGGNGDFGDYHGCSVINIRGGPLENRFKPRAMQCNARADAVGICVREPCNPGVGMTRKFPRSFQNGRSLPELKTEDFGGRPNNGNPPPPPPMNTPAPPPPMNNPPPPPPNNGGTRCVNYIRTAYGNSWTTDNSGARTIKFEDFKHEASWVKMQIEFDRRVWGLWKGERWGQLQFAHKVSDRVIEVQFKGNENYFGFNLQYNKGGVANVRQIRVIDGNHRNGRKCQRQTF